MDSAGASGPSVSIGDRPLSTVQIHSKGSITFVAPMILKAGQQSSMIKILEIIMLYIRIFYRASWWLKGLLAAGHEIAMLHV